MTSCSVLFPRPAVLSAIVALGMAAMPLAASQDAQSTQPLAVLQGRSITQGDLQRYSQAIGSVEGRIFPSMYQSLQDYILTEAHDQVATTVTVPETAHRNVPLTYPYLNQRRYLAMQLQSNVRSQTTITQTEMKSWYDQYKDQYTRPAEAEAYHIFRQVSADVATSSSKAQRAVLKKVKAEADKGTSFGLLARTYSEADSREHDGGIGRIVQGRPTGPQNRRMNVKLEEAIFGLKQGEVSDIIETSHGLHLVHVRSRREAEVPPLELLVAQGIAGRELLNDLLRDGLRKKIEAARTKSDSRVLTTNTREIADGKPMIKLGGAMLTQPHLEALYDRMYTRQWARVKENEQQRTNMLNLVLEDLLFAEAAEQAGLDKREDVASALTMMAKRNKAQRKLGAVTAEAYPVTDEQLRKLYDEVRDALRQPEAEGEVLVVGTRPYPDTPSQVRAANNAKKIADEAAKRLEADKALSLETLVRKLPTHEDVQTSWSAVPRHTLGLSDGFHMTAFDQALPGVTEPGQISAVSRVGEAYVIARLGKRHAGDPPPFESQRENMVNQAQTLNGRRMRQELIGELKTKGLLEILPAADSLKEGEFDQ